MKPNLLALLIVTAAVCLGLTGDVFFKRSAGWDWRFAVGMGLYALSGLPVWLAYRYASWMQVGILWQSLSIIVTIVLGIVLFGERLDARRTAAFLLAVAAMLLARD